jgi:hypothetical protein
MKKDDLEQMIDARGLYGVLEDIAAICYAKAEHLETNWQDANAAKVWQKCGLLADTFAAKASKLLP